jgi:hypothetical protein
VPTHHGVGLDDRQRIANIGEEPTEADEYQAIDAAEVMPPWRRPPQHIDLLAQHQFSASSAALGRNRPTSAHQINLQRSHIGPQHRPSRHHLLAGRGLRQGQVDSSCSTSSAAKGAKGLPSTQACRALDNAGWRLNAPEPHFNPARRHQFDSEYVVWVPERIPNLHVVRVLFRTPIRAPIPRDYFLPCSSV